MFKAIIAFIGIAAIAILLFLICANIVLAAKENNGVGSQEILKSVARQIEEIKKKMDLLWEEYFKLVEQSPVIKEISQKFQNNLFFGSRGNDVVNLQEFLSVLSSGGNVIYPEGLVTGYFGKLTEAAVKRFQRQYYLEETGIVDSISRRILNDLYFSKTERDWFEKTKF